MVAEKQPNAPSGIVRVNPEIKDVEQIFQMYDLHYPEIDEGTVMCMDTMIRGSKAQGLLKGFIFGGDQFDNKMISPHYRDDFEARQASYFETLDKFRKEILDPLDSLLEDRMKVWIIGNHEDWERQFVRANPNFKGMESHKYLKLKERGWRVIPCGTIFRYGKMNYFHGEWLGGQNHAKIALEKVCGNCVYGHFHTMQQAVKILSYDKRQKWQAQCMPCGGKVNPEWVRNAPNGWVNGFGVTEFRKGGYFAHYPIPVFDGECSFGGKLYAAL